MYTCSFVRRSEESKTRSIVISLISVFFALGIGGVLLALFSINPITAYQEIIIGSFGSEFAVTNTIAKAIPLMLMSLALGIAFRISYWNIGGEGQWALGGIAATGVALFAPEGLHSWLFVIIAGVLGGALWAFIPSLLKIHLNVNEVLTTLMFNYIGILFMEYLFYGPWKNPQGFGFPGTKEFPATAWLPMVFDQIHLGFIVAILLAFVLLLVSQTKIGFCIKVIGENPHAAKYAGMNIGLITFGVAVVSGGIAGMAGAMEIAGVAHKLQAGFALGYGFSAIIIAWLARLHPLGSLGVAIFFAAMLVGVDQLHVSMGVPFAVGTVLQGVIMLTVLAAEVCNHYQLSITKTGEK